MITVYLCGVSVVIASAIGIPLGALSASARHARARLGLE
jgi:ABC-type dipeptide/oligopeptide/nickel transport system permease component